MNERTYPYLADLSGEVLILRQEVLVIHPRTFTHFRFTVLDLRNTNYSLPEDLHDLGLSTTITVRCEVEKNDLKLLPPRQRVVV